MWHYHVHSLATQKKKIKNSKDKSTFFAEEKKKPKNKMLTKLKLQNVLPPLRALLFLY